MADGKLDFGERLVVCSPIVPSIAAHLNRHRPSPNALINKGFEDLGIISSGVADEGHDTESLATVEVLSGMHVLCPLHLSIASA
jgi:hypothetical protein